MIGLTGEEEGLGISLGMYLGRVLGIGLGTGPWIELVIELGKETYLE